MTETPLNILLVEDDPDHAKLIQRHLARVEGAEFRPEWVQRLDEAQQRLAQGGIDVVLLDLRLQESTGLETLSKVLKPQAQPAIVVLSSLNDKQLAVAAVKEGAQDYLVKSQLTADLLERAIRYAVERKQAQLQLMRYAGELERSNEDLKAFAYMASHDLQAPLRNVSTFCQLLRKHFSDKLDAEAIEFIDYAIDAAGRMRTLVKDLLNYCQLGFEAAKPKPTDAAAACEEAIENLQVTIEETSAVVNCRALPTVLAEHSPMVQLFQNLVDNAIKYRSDQPPRIDISAEPDNGRWRFIVRDNGIGIPAEYHAQVFDTFRRVDSTEDRSGTGIGLAICKKAVERWGGEIWVESEPGQGSTFLFRLQDGSDTRTER